MAYLVSGDRFRDPLWQAIYNVNVKTSSLDAEIITELLLTGQANEIIKRKYALAAERNRLFYEFFPRLKGIGHPLSFYRWLPVPDRRDGAEIEQELKRAGVRVYHSDRFLCGPREAQCFLRISLATVKSDGQLREGLAILKRELGL